MSIAVGKRNFAEGFSKLMINDFQRDNIYRSKMVVNENTLINRTYSNQTTAAYFSDNVNILSQQFPQVDEKELLNILDDCDNDLEIAREILQKTIQNKLNSSLLLPVDGRAIKRINGAKEAEQKNNASARRQIEEKKSESSIQEEDPNAGAKIAEIRTLSSNVIDQFQKVTNIDDAKELLTQLILHIKEEDEKKNQVVVNKLKNDKDILLSMTAKQIHRAQTAEKKNEVLVDLLGKNEAERIRLEGLTYQMGLRFKALDESPEINHNFDIY